MGKLRHTTGSHYCWYCYYLPGLLLCLSLLLSGQWAKQQVAGPVAVSSVPGEHRLPRPHGGAEEQLAHLVDSVLQYADQAYNSGMLQCLIRVPKC